MAKKKKKKKNDKNKKKKLEREKAKLDHVKRQQGLDKEEDDDKDEDESDVKEEREEGEIGFMSSVEWDEIEHEDEGPSLPTIGPYPYHVGLEGENMPLGTMEVAHSTLLEPSE